MNVTRNPSKSAITQLLTEAQLPVEDITSEHLAHFFGAWSELRLEGVVGLELYGSVALLRSLAVRMEMRGLGVGGRLLKEIEYYAYEKGARSLFLLTMTAQTYFEKYGYSVIPRDSVPDAILATAAFTHICPASAVPMVKHMANRTLDTRLELRDGYQNL